MNKLSRGALNLNKFAYVSEISSIRIDSDLELKPFRVYLQSGSTLNHDLILFRALPSYFNRNVSLAFRSNSSFILS